jgi:hypothetical protein
MSMQIQFGSKTLSAAASKGNRFVDPTRGVRHLPADGSVPRGGIGGGGLASPYAAYPSSKSTATPQAQQVVDSFWKRINEEGIFPALQQGSPKMLEGTTVNCDQRNKVVLTSKDASVLQRFFVLLAGYRPAGMKSHQYRVSKLDGGFSIYDGYDTAQNGLKVLIQQPKK